MAVILRSLSFDSVQNNIKQTTIAQYFTARDAEAVEVVKFLWKRKHFDERGWKQKQKC